MPADHLAPLPFDLDGGAAPRARLGLVALTSDYTLEHEFNAVLATLPGLGLFTTRVANSPTITPASLRAMGPRIAAAAATILLPGDLDVLAYGCTSASALLGDDAVRDALQQAHPGVPVTHPMLAAIAGLRALGVERIAVLTPYRADVNDGIAAAFEAAGISIGQLRTFAEPQDPVVARIAPASVESAARTMLDGGSADALFVSCTNLRVMHVIEHMEAALGVPVVSSNQALIRHALTLAGVFEPLPHLGRLFALQDSSAS